MRGSGGSRTSRTSAPRPSLSGWREARPRQGFAEARKPLLVLARRAAPRAAALVLPRQVRSPVFTRSAHTLRQRPGVDMGAAHSRMAPVLSRRRAVAKVRSQGSLSWLRRGTSTIGAGAWRPSREGRTTGRDTPARYLTTSAFPPSRSRPRRSPAALRAFACCASVAKRLPFRRNVWHVGWQTAACWWVSGQPVWMISSASPGTARRRLRRPSAWLPGWTSTDGTKRRTCATPGCRRCPAPSWPPSDAWACAAPSRSPISSRRAPPLPRRHAARCRRRAGVLLRLRPPTGRLDISPGAPHRGGLGRRWIPSLR